MIVVTGCLQFDNILGSRSIKAMRMAENRQTIVRINQTGGSIMTYEMIVLIMLPSESCRKVLFVEVSSRPSELVNTF